MSPALDSFWMGSLGALFAGLFTGVGGLGVLMLKRPSDRAQDGMLSGAAGIMLAATFFSLLMPALVRADAIVEPRTLGVAIVAAGLLLGAAGLFAIHRYVPHEHFVLGREGPETQRVARIWLFVIAITLHNFPEGMAVGVGFAGGDVSNGVPLAVGIALQNVPEGFAVALSLIAVGHTRARAFWVAMLTGLVEPVGGVLGAAALSLAEPLMPFILGTAAGAMLFVISDEIIPETHRRGYENVATFSLLGGFVLMMFLDTLLG